MHSCRTDVRAPSGSHPLKKPESDRVPCPEAGHSSRRALARTGARAPRSWSRRGRTRHPRRASHTPGLARVDPPKPSPGRRGSNDHAPGNGEHADREPVGLAARVHQNAGSDPVVVLLDERHEVTRIRDANARAALDFQGHERPGCLDDEVHLDAAARSAASRCSIRTLTGTRVTLNTGIPPGISGFLPLGSRRPPA